ncbi:hypothetical protein [Jiangella rhizosphaerae]|uniref:hypothetical protein n=1 Tax=Jiangella rhizosphaerae TaxID=2293569 RepID=UPI001313FAAD|nr:hypothetical protein [Jiangella rhizosphaerae]
MARLLFCDACPSTTVADDSTGGWFVFTDHDGPGNARCPECLPDHPGQPFDLAQL